MSEQPPRRPFNLYRKGYFPAVRDRLARYGRAVWLPLSRPQRVPAAFFGWLQRSLEQDALFFATLIGGSGRMFVRGLRHPVHRRWLLAAFALAGFLLTFSWQRCGLRGCPNVRQLASLAPGGAATILDAEGNVLADLAPTRWAVVDIDDLPAYVGEAFVAVEDQHFYRHHGVHWPRFLAQTARNLLPGG